MAIITLKSNEINPNTDMKNKINEIINALNGTDTTVSRAVVAALLGDLPTANPGPGLFWLNAGVVTAGS